MGRDWKNIEVGAGGGEGEKVPVLILLVQTGDLVEISHGAPVEGVESLGDPVTVLLAGTAPPVMMESHAAQPGPGPSLAQSQVQLGQLVVVEADGRQLAQNLEHCRAEPGEFVVVEIQQLQGLQSRHLLTRDPLDLVVTEVEGSQS